MTALFRSPRTRRRDGDEGFTLIELLVVVVIIGVLIAIAVPLYNNYKKGAQNTAAQSDVRNAVTAVEAFYTANGNTYPKPVTGVLGADLALVPTSGTANPDEKISVSSGNQLVLKVSNPTATGSTQAAYAICGWSSTGKNLYVYKSLNGKTTKVTGQTGANVAACVTTIP